MTDAAPVYLPSYEAKQQIWPARVLPQIIARANEAAQGAAREAVRAWLIRAGFDPDAQGASGGRLAQLHALARAGHYADDPPGFDVVYPVPQTLAAAGDCDDWAAAILAVLMAWRLPARIVTAGTDDDHFAHVYVRARAADGAWRTLDAKGSHAGLPFDQEPPRAMYPIRRVWAWTWNAQGEPVITEEAAP